MANLATGGIVFNNDPMWGGYASTAAGYSGYITGKTVTMNITYDGANADSLKHFISGIVDDDDEKLEPTQHPTVAVGDDIEIINLTNGDQVEGRLEDILTGDDVEYVYVINERRYFEPEWTILD